MVDTDNQYLGVTKESTISVQVPQSEPNLTELNVVSNGVYTPTAPVDGYNKVTVSVPQTQNEYLQNKRITSNGNYLVQNLMNNPVDYDGISKTSNLVIDVPSPDITQITNYSITQNGTQTVPIPSGYDAVDSISLNVQVPSITYIDRIGYEGGRYLFSDFSINTNDNYITVTSRYMFFNFAIYNNNIRFKLLVNDTPGNMQIRPFYNSTTNIGYYIVANYNSSSVVESISLRTSSDQTVILLTDNSTLDTTPIEGYIYRQFIDFVVPS